MKSNAYIPKKDKGMLICVSPLATVQSLSQRGPWKQ